MNYKVYTLSNYKDLPQIKDLSDDLLKDIDIVGSVFPFKTNSYVTEKLINWDNVPDDPFFILTFPQKKMLIKEHYNRVASLVERGAEKGELKNTVNEIREELNPHPAGQLNHNVPVVGEERLYGLQHKYLQTVLFFPSQGQTCHAYCTFCFRWPQFTGVNDYKFASQEADQLTDYIRQNKCVSDVLLTGGDPMVMSTNLLKKYILPLLEVPHLKNIRIGTKFLSYWPYRVLDDPDADDLLRLLETIVSKGKHLALMAHFNHPSELDTPEVSDAVKRLNSTGAVIRTQSPLLRHINDSSDIWRDMWLKQVSMDMVPYYMFLARDTGAQHYFAVNLEKAWEIFQKAYQQMSGIGRTVRGPSMSCDPGKIQVMGVSEIKGEKVYVLTMLQGRNPDWVLRPFYAKYNPKAIWLDDLQPAFGEDSFFFEKELEKMYV